MKYVTGKMINKCVRQITSLSKTLCEMKNQYGEVTT